MRIAASLLCLALLEPACGGGSPTSPDEAPVVRQVQPATLAVGDEVVMTGSGFTATGNGVRIGSGYLNGLPSSDGTSLRFVLPSALGACPPGTQACIALAILVTPGTYQVAVVNSHGTSNEVTMVVVGR